MSEIAKELDYQKRTFSHPQYKLNKVLQQSGGQAVSISGGGGQVSIFEIPAQVVNFAKTQLYYTMTPTEDQVAGPANGANWIPKDCASEIASIQLYTRGGVYLVNLGYNQNYTKVVPKAETSVDEYLAYDIGGDTTIEDGLSRFIRRSNSLASSSTKTAIAPYAKRNDNTSASLHYTEHQYCEPGVLYDGANAGNTPVITRCCPLSHFKNTILACDKDLYFGEVLILRIEWSPVNRIGWLGSSVTNPTTDSEPITVDVGLTNLALYVAVEKDQEIINSLMSKVQSGFQMLCPYVHGYKTNLQNASQSLSLRFNRGHGERLMKIYHAPFNNTETTHLAYDHNNLADAKVLSYYTMLNNSRLQEFNVDTSADEDYMILKDLLEGSVIQNNNIYKYNWFHVEDFAGLDLKDSQGPFNKRAGLDLSVEQKYDIYMTTAGNALNHYSFAVTQRMLTISPAGIEFV